MSSTQPAGWSPFQSMRRTGRGSVLTWTAILGAALAVRLAFAMLLPPSFVFSDTQDYDRMARELVDHGTYEKVPLRAPGYSTFMAAVYLVFGKSVVAVRCVEAVIGTLSVGMIGILGTRLFGRAPGRIAGVLAAFHPIMAFLPSALYTENITIFFILLALILAFEGVRRPGLWRWAGCGMFLGIALLIRPNVLGMLPGLALGFALVLGRERREWLGPALAVFAALVLTVLPWTVRNHHVYGRWFFISTGGARQFHAGNNPTATGITWIHPEYDPVTLVDLRRLPDTFAQDKYLTEKGWQFIREHPARAAHLYLIELGNIFALYPETMTRTLMNRWSRLSQTIASLVIFAGALISLRRLRVEPALWPMVGAIITFSLVNALVYSSMRYRMVFEPCLILMAALGWETVRRSLAAMRTSRQTA